MKNSVKIRKFFIKELDLTYYKVNQDLKFSFTSEKEAAGFLVELIRFWKNKTVLFCNEYGATEKDWGFYYKTPSDCGSCVRAQIILTRIFGKDKGLSFIEFLGSRQYYFKFSELKKFAGMI